MIITIIIRCNYFGQLPVIKVWCFLTGLRRPPLLFTAPESRQPSFIFTGNMHVKEFQERTQPCRVDFRFIDIFVLQNAIGIIQTGSLSSLPNQTEHAPQRVRFDDGLHLSEQSIRSSCRKLLSSHSLSGYVPARDGQPYLEQRRTNLVPLKSALRDMNGRTKPKCTAQNGCIPKRPLCIKMRSHPPPVQKNRMQKTRSYCALNKPDIDDSQNPIKSSSCQNLNRNVVRDDKNNCVLYSENMINVYARLASVIPNEETSSGTCQLADKESGTPSDRCSAPSDGPKGVEQDRVQKLLIEHRTLVEARRNGGGSESKRNAGSDGISVKKSRVINKENFSTESGREIIHKAPETPKSGNGIHSSSPTHHCLVTKPYKGQHPQQKQQGVHTYSSYSSPTNRYCDVIDSGTTEQKEPVVCNGTCSSANSELKHCFSCSQLDQYAENPSNDIQNINRSDLDIFRGSNKRRNFTSRFQFFKNSAKSAVLKAFNSEKSPKAKDLDKNKGLIGTIRNSFRRKKKTRDESVARLKTEEVPDKPKERPISGHILHINRDGSQIIEIESKEDPLPIFTVAKARDLGGKGVVVTRMQNAEIKHLLVGLLDVGDQILEIENEPVCHISIETINKIITGRRKMRMKIMPFTYGPEL
ncbi:hypothetical protein GQR58_022370 [Nymphon striatum]|nr:hypothetical protein GQR58_022370 [Nymphon striatum]